MNGTSAKNLRYSYYVLPAYTAQVSKYTVSQTIPDTRVDSCKITFYASVTGKAMEEKRSFFNLYCRLPCSFLDHYTIFLLLNKLSAVIHHCDNLPRFQVHHTVVPKIFTLLHADNDP